MIGKILGAIIGSKVAGRNEGVKGAALGYGITAIAKRGLGPLGVALALGWGGKKLYDKYQNQKTPSYPPSATPERRDI